MDRSFFAACTLGLENVLAGELTALGASDVHPGRGGVEFRGDENIGYRACLWLRSAVHVQELLVDAAVESPDDLYDRVFAVQWETMLAPDGTLAVDASVRDSFTTHSGFAALKTKDAVVDRFRDRVGRRPDVDTDRPDLPLKLVLKQDRMRLYRVWSGDSLHKRGYRPIQVKSPLNEAIAAGLLLATEWDRASPILDPLCGSGTFLVEAAFLALDRAPGFQRGFACERWIDLDRGVHAAARDEAQRRLRPSLPFLFDGADRHPGAIAIARQSARAAGVERMIRFTHAELAQFEPPQPPAFLVTNPPYGERLGAGDDLEATWRDLGAFLHQKCRGATAWILSGNPEVTRLLGLRAEGRVPVRNGTIDCRFLRYRVFAG